MEPFPRHTLHLLHLSPPPGVVPLDCHTGRMHHRRDVRPQGRQGQVSPLHSSIPHAARITSISKVVTMNTKQRQLHVRHLGPALGHLGYTRSGGQVGPRPMMPRRVLSVPKPQSAGRPGPRIGGALQWQHGWPLCMLRSEVTAVDSVGLRG